MIKIIKGTYGFKPKKGAVIAKTRRSAPFSLAAAEEKRLVNGGVAVYVTDNEKTSNKQNEPEEPVAETTDEN